MQIRAPRSPPPIQMHAELICSALLESNRVKLRAAAAPRDPVERPASGRVLAGVLLREFQAELGLRIVNEDLIDRKIGAKSAH